MRYRLKTIWDRMKDRCYNQNHISFKYYGAEGIEVCKEWYDDFSSFEEWSLSNGYNDDLTLDRKDNKGNYCPDNCRWVNREIQQANRRDNIRRFFNGEMMTPAEISRITGKSYIAEYLKTKRLIKKNQLNIFNSE